MHAFYFSNKYKYILCSVNFNLFVNILHEKHIFHRDLKSANVFLNKNGVSKLGDLNVSKVAKKGLLYT